MINTQEHRSPTDHPGDSSTAARFGAICRYVLPVLRWGALRILLLLNLIGDGALNDVFIEVMPENVTLHLPPLPDPVPTDEAPIYIFSGPPGHLVQAKFEQQPGLLPTASSETSDRGLIHAQRTAYPSCGPALLFGVEPRVEILGTPSRSTLSKPLIERGLWHRGTFPHF